jgi:hypothetical protein
MVTVTTYGTGCVAWKTGTTTVHSPGSTGPGMNDCDALSVATKNSPRSSP